MTVSPVDAAALAQAFHEAYERLAPSFGYETRAESAVSWADVPEQNKALMTAVCEEVVVSLLAVREAAAKDLRGWIAPLRRHALNSEGMDALADDIAALAAVPDGPVSD